jgi:hypothetical protein
MQGISDIKIVGVDKSRPSVIRKQPYIDIFFRLSHQAPVAWCNDFNGLLSKHPSTPRIVEKEGLFIETWVRKPNDIVGLLEKLKETVTECSRQYIERIELSAKLASSENASLAGESGEQGRLNNIIASLDFS